MKRFACALLASSALVGCQSPGGGYSMQGPQRNPSGVASSQAGASSTKTPSGYAMNQKAKSGEGERVDSGVVPAGYNSGWGSIQNDNYFGKVARAIPSHGGSFPGGPEFPGVMPGAPGGHGGGCASGHCGAPMAGPPMMPPPSPGMNLMPRFLTGRTQVRFTRPTGMNVAWQASGEFTPPQLEVPARFNFQQARIYRLKLTSIENRPGLELYPTLEVYPGNMKVDAYLAHNAVPIEFTDEDFDQVSGGNFVTKVIYLPDPKFQELAIAGVETLVSTRLDPGMDPVQEANRRGAILAVLRIGSVDLEMPHSPQLFAPLPLPPTAAMPNMPPGGPEVPVADPSAMTGSEVPSPAAVPEDVPSLPEASIPIEP